jgi:hypothetical protein
MDFSPWSYKLCDKWQRHCQSALTVKSIDEDSNLQCVHLDTMRLWTADGWFACATEYDRWVEPWQSCLIILPLQRAAVLGNNLQPQCDRRLSKDNAKVGLFYVIKCAVYDIVKLNSSRLRWGGHASSFHISCLVFIYLLRSTSKIYLVVTALVNYRKLCHLASRLRPWLVMHNITHEVSDKPCSI